MDDSNRPREHNVGGPSSTPSASTDLAESDCGVGTDIQVHDGGNGNIQVYDGRVGISYPVLTSAPPPHDVDESGGTFC